MADPADPDLAARALEKARQKSKSEYKLLEDNAAGSVLMVQTTHKVPMCKTKRQKPQFLPRGFTFKGKHRNEPNYIVTAPWRTTSPFYYTAVCSNNASSTPTLFVNVEVSTNDTYFKQLKREVTILRTAATSSAGGHFLRIESQGRNKDPPLNYVIVPLCEMSLEALKYPLTQSDSIRLSMKTLQAIMDLHSLGFLHRNIRPSVFLLSDVGGAEWRLYLSGFGYSYRFRKKDGHESRSFKQLFRMSRLKFLSRTYHYNKEFSLRDDLESWTFLTAHLMDEACVDWKEEQGDLQMLSAKERFFCLDQESALVSCLPKDMQSIVRYVHRLEPDARPDYAFLSMMLHEIGVTGGFRMNGLYDYQQKVYGRVHPWAKVTRRVKKKSRGPPLITPTPTKTTQTFSTERGDSDRASGKQQPSRRSRKALRQSKTKRDMSASPGTPSGSPGPLKKGKRKPKRKRRRGGSCKDRVPADSGAAQVAHSEGAPSAAPQRNTKDTEPEPEETQPKSRKETSPPPEPTQAQTSPPPTPSTTTSGIPTASGSGGAASGQPEPDNSNAQTPSLSGSQADVPVIFTANKVPKPEDEDPNQEI